MCQHGPPVPCISCIKSSMFINIPSIRTNRRLWELTPWIADLVWMLPRRLHNGCVLSPANSPTRNRFSMKPIVPRDALTYPSTMLLHRSLLMASTRTLSSLVCSCVKTVNFKPSPSELSYGSRRVDNFHVGWPTIWIFRLICLRSMKPHNVFVNVTPNTFSNSRLDLWDIVAVWHRHNRRHWFMLKRPNLLDQVELEWCKLWMEESTIHLNAVSFVKG